MDERRDEEGKFNQKYPSSAFLEAVKSLEVASTQNVANDVGCSYDLAYRRLKELKEEGYISNQKVGRSFIWLPE